MILVTRLNGLPFAVNPDLLERVEATPDTVLTLIDGTKYLVTETVAEVVALVRDFRASVVASARDYVQPPPGGTPRPPEPHLHLAPPVDDRVAAPTPLPHRGA
jgi:flagellar protein FlbD